uniref:Uncharacterized protein n=1 Tax=Arundo donax TaxID=35708 RepID=A0A0A9C8D8_ARUDO
MIVIHILNSRHELIKLIARFLYGHTTTTYTL